jgi:hypothetical protein
MKQKFLSFLDAARRKKDAFAVKARIEAGSAAAALTDTRGEQNTSTSGLVIFALIAVGAAILFFNKKSPAFFSSLGNKLKGLFNLS